MNPPQPHQNRHGVAGLQISAFSEDEIAQANREHDRKNGWSEQSRQIFTNPSRRPETVYCEAKDVWKDQR